MLSTFQTCLCLLLVCDIIDQMCVMPILIKSMFNMTFLSQARKYSVVTYIYRLDMLVVVKSVV